MAIARPPKNVFVCGLHRSGTTLIAKAIGAHPEVASFKNTHATEQEGQFLQSVLPTDRDFGGPGRFAFRQDAHLTERSPLATPANAAMITEEWARYLPAGCRSLVEKSPPNLIRTRLLQSLFPDARFVVVTRHPVAVALATQKWTHTSPFSLISHWVRAHQLFEQDRHQLRHVHTVSYEAFVASPDRELRRIWRFLDLPEHHVDVAAQNRNDGYFERWRREFVLPTGDNIAWGSPALQRLWKKLRPVTSVRSALERFQFGRRSDARDAVQAFEPEVRGFGYSLVDLDLAPFGVASSDQRKIRLAGTAAYSALPASLRSSP